MANISLECLLHDIEFVYDAPVVAPTGKVRFERERERERDLGLAMREGIYNICCTHVNQNKFQIKLFFFRVFFLDLWKIETVGEKSSK